MSYRTFKGDRLPTDRNLGPRLTSKRQDNVIHFSHFYTATKISFTVVGTNNRQIHPGTVRNRLRHPYYSFITQIVDVAFTDVAGRAGGDFFMEGVGVGAVVCFADSSCRDG